MDDTYLAQVTWQRDQARDALKRARADLDRSRETARRLNYRAQRAESRLAAIARIVKGWAFTVHGTFVPLPSLTAIARLAGREISGDRLELHHQRMRRLEAELAELHTGEQPYTDERIVPTPGQWIWLWNRATPERRLAKAAQVLEMHDRLDRHEVEERALHKRTQAAETQLDLAYAARQNFRLRAQQAEKHLAAAETELAAWRQQGRREQRLLAAWQSARRRANTPPPAEEACRVIEIDGTAVRLLGGTQPGPEALAAFADIIRAGKRRFAAEHPDSLRTHNSRIWEDEDGWHVSCEHHDCPDSSRDVGSEYDAEEWAEDHKAQATAEDAAHAPSPTR